jgi:hypothetical protein
MDMQIRTRLLAAALADHDGLSAALVAAKEAEAWLQGGQPAPVPVYFLPAALAASVDLKMWAGDAELDIVRDGDLAIASPAAPAPEPPAFYDPRENGHDTRSEPAPAPAEPAEPAAAPLPTCAAPGAPPSWLEATLAAARGIEARLGHIRQPDIAFTLNITPGIAGYRLKVMGERGLVTSTGRTNSRRFHLTQAAAFDPHAVTPDPSASEPGAASAPQTEPEPPAVPEPPAPAPVPPARPATPKPRPPVLMGKGLRPVPPPPVVRPATAMKTTIEDVVAFLRGRGLQVSGGPDAFTYEGLAMSASELLQTCNVIREGLRKPPLAVDGLAAR